MLLPYISDIMGAQGGSIMKKRKILLIFLICLFTLALIPLGLLVYINTTEWGFYYPVPEDEATLRLSLVENAEKWLGASEHDGSHEAIIDIYNAHEPLAQGYAVTYTDNWCATFVSAVAIETELTDIIPTECGCQRQIELFRELGCWEEADNYISLPGDLIYYAWDESPIGDNVGWADHVGIVVGTSGPFIKVIEGNKDDCVSYRIVPIGYPSIRGYALVDYAHFQSEKRD